MRRLAVLSMHTSPLDQPGHGDGGGMNVYVRELSSALARAGVVCDVYTRATSPDAPPIVAVEPGFCVHHVAAGPAQVVPKGRLHEFVDQFAVSVERTIVGLLEQGEPTDAIHANYWLSGAAGHALKHRLDLPLVVTFHTLDRVKAVATPEEIDADSERRALGELAVVGCADALLASCEVEADQLVELYGANRSRVEIVSPGVDHAFFSPGNKTQARRAIDHRADGPVLLFVGRIQPLKGADVAVRCLAQVHELGFANANLIVVGGPSGPGGDAEYERLMALTAELRLSSRVRFVVPQPHELLSTYYRAADVCLVPSRSESFGLVALEAAACGTPVVASAVGGLTSLVEDGKSGFLVDARSVDSFATCVAKLLGDPFLTQEMSAASAKRARRYTWSIAAARLRRLYGELTSQALVECR